MATKIINDSYLSAIADAIRDKNGSTATYKPSEMAAAITAIDTTLGRIIVTAPTGSTVTCSNGTVTKTATESGGTWTFRECAAGTWTVTATQGSNTATATVTVI